MRLFVLALAAAALAGCGGSSSEDAVAPAATERAAVTQPNAGCDAGAQCLPALAQAALARCPAASLDARGRDARRRLEKLVDRIADVDLHNEQAYEASDAAATALARLEEACLGER